jgi:hypothetical protein
LAAVFSARPGLCDLDPHRRIRKAPELYRRIAAPASVAHGVEAITSSKAVNATPNLGVVFIIARVIECLSLSP